MTEEVVEPSKIYIFNYLEEYLHMDESDADDGKNEEENDFTFEVNGYMSNVNFDNWNLSAIVNGNPLDLIKPHQFDWISTWQNIQVV